MWKNVNTKMYCTVFVMQTLVKQYFRTFEDKDILGKEKSQKTQMAKVGSKQWVTLHNNNNKLKTCNFVCFG